MKKILDAEPVQNMEYDPGYQKYAEQKRKAVDDIAEILCGTKESVPAPEQVEVKKLDMETGTMQLLGKAEVITADLGRMQCDIVQPAIMPEGEFEIDSVPQDGTSKAELRLYNAAIDALDALIKGVDLLEIHNSTAITEAVFNLKNTRTMRFAYLIDWNRLAEE